MSKTIEKEIWKVPIGYPMLESSNLGRVRNRDTHTICREYYNKRSEYNYIRVRVNGESKLVYVHKLIALAFLGDRPEGFDINHKDGKKLNNQADNLEYCSRSDNIRHAYKMGLNKFKTPIIIVETDEMFDSISDCARAINGDPELIRQCLYPQYSRKTHKGYHFRPVDTYDTGRRPIKVRIKETGEEFNSLRECERAINGSHTNIVTAAKNNISYNGLHFEIIEQDQKKEEKKRFLYPHQEEAIAKMFNGCILNGGVGSGKSRTGLFYYFKEQGGWIEGSDYIPMKHPKDLYIISTAKKRDDHEWDSELAFYRMSPKPELNTLYDNKITVDSWQNIGKYTDVKNAFFIFDEDHVTGSGAWVKAFLKITKSNDWIILSATAGDTWIDFIPVFLANGFYRNKTEFIREHVIYSRFTKYPKVDRYINTGRLIRLRDKILIDMDFMRHTNPHHEDVYCTYNINKYKNVMKTRWDPYRDEPIRQASGLCYILRRIVNEDESRQIALLELFEKHPRIIIFYNFDYERDILLNLFYGDGVEIAEYSGHAHQPIPDSKRWIYLVNYNAGAEGFNCIKTDTIVFYSQNYSYKTMIQAAGRIDRLNSPYLDLYYYHLKTRSGIDLAISKALRDKKKFNERKFTKWD